MKQIKSDTAIPKLDPEIMLDEIEEHPKIEKIIPTSHEEIVKQETMCSIPSPEKDQQRKIEKPDSHLSKIKKRFALPFNLIIEKRGNKGMEEKQPNNEKLVIMPSKKTQLELQEEKQGAHAIIQKVIEKSTGKEQASKQIRTNDLEHLKQAEIEFKIMKKLNHQNIISAQGFFVENEGIQLVMEQVPYKSLCHQVKKKKVISENRAVSIILPVIQAVIQMHEKNICHRDISSKNILISANADRVKIIDFGIAKEMKKNKIDKFLKKKGDLSPSLFTPTGNLQQMAPEMKSFGSQDEKVDVWAVGIILLEILLKKKKLVKASQEFINLSYLAQDFLTKLLDPMPLTRVSAKQASEHQWVRKLALKKTTEVIFESPSKKKHKKPIKQIRSESSESKQEFQEEKNEKEANKHSRNLKKSDSFKCDEEG